MKDVTPDPGSGKGGGQMVEETRIEKSLIDQILDEMFADVEGRVEFNNKTIQDLKELVISGNLKKHEPQT